MGEELREADCGWGQAERPYSMVEALEPGVERVGVSAIGRPERMDLTLSWVPGVVSVFTIQLTTLVVPFQIPLPSLQPCCDNRCSNRKRSPSTSKAAYPASRVRNEWGGTRGEWFRGVLRATQQVRGIRG